MTEWVFVSSSADLAEVRQKISAELTTWLRENGFEHAVAPYLWEVDKEDGQLLSDRIPVQQQLRDPASSDVPLTICLFAERCGSPLDGELPPHWHDRLTRWRADAGGPGVLHPWPNSPEAQAKALEQGAFPLTGTVFELLSAHYRDGDPDNLVMGYVAPRSVDDGTRIEDVDFNERRLWDRLTAHMNSDAEREPVLRNIYGPQKRALLNLLKFLRRRIVPARSCDSLEKLQAEVVARAKHKIRQRLGMGSLHNHFKLTLEHWSIDERQELPGRGALVKKICTEIEAHTQTLFLLKGRSGCGKSSLLQRGVLARLREQGAVTVSLRPTDLDEVSESRDRLDILWQVIEEQVGFRSRAVSHPRVRRNRDRGMAQYLIGQLEQRSIKLVIGLDQFEEILDELNLFQDGDARGKGWWLVMRFFSQIAASRHVKLVATLESSREKTFLDLNIERELNLGRNSINADVDYESVAEIAKHGFSRGGLQLHSTVLEAIKLKWQEFEKQIGGDASTSSPLPLVCLWLARLYERFEDRARLTPRDGFDAAASRQPQGSGPLLTLADIGSEGIAFENVIQKLADEAWEAAGKSRHFKEPIETDPAYLTLFNFLGSLIGLDNDGHKRLLAVADVGGIAITDRLRQEFKNRRLLVDVLEGGPGGTSRRTRRIRLVHQAVIDRWSPARRLFEARKNYLRLEVRLRREAQYWSSHGKVIPVHGPSDIADAAEVLYAHRIDWQVNAVKDLAADDEILKRQALAVFSQSETPRAIVPGSVSALTHAHLAAYYHLVELLKRFDAADPGCLHAVCGKGDTLLHMAAWSEGPAIDFLLDHGVPPGLPSCSWNAIQAPIELALHDSYRRLIEKIQDIDGAIESGGWRLVHVAAYYGNLQVLDDLKKRGANLGAMRDNGATALHAAAWSGHATAFMALLEHASPLLAESNQLNTPLGYAAMQGHDCVIRAFLNGGKDEATVIAALTQKNRGEHTPLMIAAKYKQPGALRVLLDVCDPRDEVHKTKRGQTVLHLAVDSGVSSESSGDVRARAQKTVQVLLEDDGRIDPTQKDSQGRTAFDIADAYEDARRMIRRDKRMPRDYLNMTPKMRIDDLTSRQPEVVLDLLRAAPQALTDRHDDEGTGLQILLRAKNTDVLATVLKETWVGDDLMHASLLELAKLACDAAAGRMRAALIDRLKGDEAEAKALPLLLNAALAAMDRPAVLALRSKGASYLRGADAQETSVFHSLAMAGRHEDFAQAAALAGLVLPLLSLPLDSWGRRPSELAAQNDRWRFREIEEKSFSAAQPDQLQLPVPTKFHKYAQRGDIRRFERQARGRGDLILPLDAEGRRPSEVAPGSTKAKIAALEARYFKGVD